MTDKAASPSTVHATAVAVGSHGVLIRGKPGAGKSDLALRMLELRPGPLVADQPMLVADDRVVLTATPGAVTMSCPPTLSGLIEVRGVGIVPVPSVQSAELGLIVDLVAAGEVPRMPEAGASEIICGVGVPCIALFPYEASAALKVILALADAVARRGGGGLSGRTEGGKREH